MATGKMHKEIWRSSAMWFWSYVRDRQTYSSQYFTTLPERSNEFSLTHLRLAEISVI